MRIRCRIARVLILAPVLALIAASPSPPSHPKKILVGTAPFPPFRIVNGTSVTGVDAEIVSLAFKEMGYEMELDAKPWNRTYQEGVKGKLPVIFSFTKTPEREKDFVFSDPINTVKDVFFKRKEDKIDWYTLADLKPYTVGLSAGYSYAPQFMDAVRGQVFTVDPVSGTMPETMQLSKLAKKRIDLFICEASVCSYLIDQGGDELKGLDYINRVIGDVRTFHVGFSKAAPEAVELVPRFNAALKSLRRSGTIGRLYRQYGIVETSPIHEAERPPTKVKP